MSFLSSHPRRPPWRFSRRRDRRAHHQCGRGRPGQRPHRPAVGPFLQRKLGTQAAPPGADGRVFGVYSGYASDQHGAFDVTAGVAAPADHQALQGATTVDIEAGTYLVFEAEGQMPQLVIDAWGAVWRYFADHPQVQRRFGTDF